jgi:hypothetical protein
MRVYFTEERTIADNITGEVFDLEEEQGVWTWEKKYMCIISYQGRKSLKR